MAGEISKIDNSKFKSKWENKILWAEIAMGIAFAAFVILFCIHQPLWLWGSTIDTAKWGTFGDFIGGLLGTGCAYISLRLLVKNLKEQERANECLQVSNDRSSEVFEMQLVHQNITTLLDSYKRVIESYRIEKSEIKGLDAIKKISTDLYEKYDKDNSHDIEGRIEDARQLFDAEYIKYRNSMAVYYRLLYQIFQVLWQSELDGNKKAMLSKMIRSQFTEDELLLLRYNCLTPNGEKMRFYINQFNLLKHLPLTHLLEFKKWVVNMTDVQKNRLDTECVYLRKCIKNLLAKDNREEIVQELAYSKRYRSIVTISADKRECRFEIIRNKRETPSTDDTSMDQVLERWNDNDMKNFFVDFFNYLFVYSNYSLFNNKNELTIKSDIKTEENGNKHTVWTLVKKDKSPLVIAMSQNEDPKK